MQLVGSTQASIIVGLSQRRFWKLIFLTPVPAWKMVNSTISEPDVTKYPFQNVLADMQTLDQWYIDSYMLAIVLSL